MFGGGGEDEAPGRYSFEMVSGHLREKSHKSDVQKALNEGSNRGWELVNASHSASSGGYVTVPVGILHHAGSPSGRALDHQKIGECSGRSCGRPPEDAPGRGAIGKGASRNIANHSASRDNARPFKPQREVTNRDSDHDGIGVRSSGDRDSRAAFFRGR